MILSQIIILPAVSTPVPVVHIPKHGREDPRQSMDHRGHFLPACGNIPPVAAMLFFLKFQYPEQAVSQMRHYKPQRSFLGILPFPVVLSDLITDFGAGRTAHIFQTDRKEIIHRILDTGSVCQNTRGFCISVCFIV